MTVSLPSWSSASFIARMEPSASPSGFSWVTTRKRSSARHGPATAATSLVVWGELIDQLRHADPALDCRIVFERELGRPLHAELAGEPALQDAVRRLEAGEACRPSFFAPEHAHVDARVTQVRRGFDARHRDEADPRVLQLADRLGKHLADSLVHAAHAVAHRPYSSGDHRAGEDDKPRTTARPAAPAVITAAPATIADHGSVATSTRQPRSPATLNARGHRRRSGGCV